MSDSKNQAFETSGIALRYPEKTFYLGQVFNDTTNSYKFYWLLSILSLFRKSKEIDFRLSDIFTEMATIAWHTVCLFRLSLGRQDKLQDMILEIETQSQRCPESRLFPNSEPEEVRDFIRSSSSSKVRFESLKINVPTRFLSPWFADRLRGVADFKRKRAIEEMALKSQHTPFACPYWFEATSIKFNESWRAFLIENMAVVQAFTEYHLSNYLQSRNPNVPGIVNKLRAPTSPQLSVARQFWRFVRDEFAKVNQKQRFRDIYSERPLEDVFAVDHFLPWSFVVHDLLWNLTPVEPATNSKKGDVLPDLILYIPRLAKLHFGAVEVAQKHPKLLEDYADCFRVDPPGLLALGEDGLTAKYLEVLKPQTQIAINQGFRFGWKLREDVAE